MISIFIVVYMTGCTAVSVVEEAAEASYVTAYEQPYWMVWNALKESIYKSEMDIIADSESSGIILVRCKNCDQGENKHIAFYVDQQKDANRTKVDCMDTAKIHGTKTRDLRIQRILNVLDSKLIRKVSLAK